MRVGTVCYATDQGLGMLAKWYHAAGVIPPYVAGEAQDLADFQDFRFDLGG